MKKETLGGTRMIKIESPYPEYRLTLAWRRDQDGQSIRAFLVASEPGKEDRLLQSSSHPGLDLHQALESALTNFFEERSI
jgi:hypothetical protein